MADSVLRTRLFVAVYEERSFTAAAHREAATQSGVSQHIHKLEDQLGVRLFLRDKNSVTPTPAGDVYYAACLNVLTAHEAAKQAVRSYGSGLDGEIVVGLTPTAARTLLAPSLASFIAAHPNVVVRVVEAYSDVVTDKVAAGEFDFAIVPSLQNARGIQSKLFARTPEFLVTSRTTTLRPWEPVRLADLAAMKLVLPSTAQTRRAHLEGFIAAVGARVERRLEIDTMLGTLDFVARTDWMTILPGLMLANERRGGELSIHPLIDPPLVLDLFQIHSPRRAPSPAALAFLQTMHVEIVRVGQQVARLADGSARDQDC